MKFSKLTVRDVPLDNQTVLLRVDYDTPLNDKGELGHDSRIVDSIPTIKHLLQRGCKVVIIGHIGRREKHSFEKAAVKLAPMLGHSIRFVDGVIGDKVYQAIKLLPKSSVSDVYNAHASTSAITQHIPSVAGLLLERVHRETTYKLPGIESLLDARH